MKKQNIDELFEETFDLITELATISIDKGFHLDNDLEGGLFELLLRKDYREMILLKARVEYVIKQIENDIFKIKEVANILSDKKVA